jgi:outer membrane protein OmpA-like peptidoglycan-associated protein/tetratricopeptide (TPR) repeat protein
MRKQFILFTFCLISVALFSAPNEQRKLNIKRTLQIGDKFYAESLFYSASEYYKDVVKVEPENRYANYWLAMSLFQARDYEKAEVFFEKFNALKSSKKESEKKVKQANLVIYNQFRYYYGQCLHRNGKYDEAIAQLNKFSGEYKEADKDVLNKLVKLEIAGCEFAKAAPKNGAKIKAKPLVNVNHSYSELSPALADDNTLVFSSIPSDTLIFIKTVKNRNYYKLYESKLDNNEWAKGKQISNEEVNDPKYTVCNGTFNKERSRFYFNKCVEMDDDRALCNIFVADYKGGKFSNVVRLPEPVNIKEKYTSTQPAVYSDADGREVMYFSSDREGGKGGMDIWYSSRQKSGEFTAPKLLGGTVNTAGDEITPFFDDSTKTLYFSSDGHPGFGGLDIFSSQEQPDLGWSTPKNMGQPLNTGLDELYYSRTFNQAGGFFTSNRPGSKPLNGIATASDDIFTWENFKYAVTGLALQEDNGGGGGSLDGAIFNLYVKKPDGTKELISIDSSSKNGSYFFKLAPDQDFEVEAVRAGFAPKVEAISTKDLPFEDTLNRNITVRKGIYVLTGVITEQGKPGVAVDDVFVLIQENAGSVEKTIFSGKTGAGSNKYGVILEADKNYQFSFKKEGYFANNFGFSTKGLGQVDSIKKDIELNKLELNKEYTLQNVLYEFGKSTLTENSKAVLDILYNILVENPSFVIELSAHTDAIGSDAANLKLSQARAESCVAYLISKGIVKERLIPKGYGESKPKVPNQTEDGKDDPAGRAVNRRTEFKIIKS